MDAQAEKVALFRYALVAPLVLETLPRGELTRRAEEIAARQYEIPSSQRSSVSVDTLLEWALRYRKGGLEALAPKPRQDRGQSRAIPPSLAELIERLKRENPHRTGTTLLRELALADQNSPPLSAATLYRFLKQRGLTARQLLAPPARKKFEAERSNQIWQADMLFGPYVQRPGGGKLQVFLHAILDDASRLIPHAQFYSSQGLDSCLDCLRQAVAARGLPTRLYMDNAKMYRGQQLARIAASIGILIVHTPPYQPEGRGKIERYFRSVRQQFLANLDPKLTLSLEDLNQRLWTWIDTVYHRFLTQRSPDHPAATLATRHRTHPPAPARHRSAPPLLSSRRPTGAPRLYLPVAPTFLRGSFPSAQPDHRSPFRSPRPSRGRDLFPGATPSPGAPRRSRGKCSVALFPGTGFAHPRTNWHQLHRTAAAPACR